VSFSDGDGWMEMTKDAGSAGPLAVAAATAAAAAAAGISAAVLSDTH